MDFDRLWIIADRARGRSSLARDDVEFVRNVVPSELSSFPTLKLPKTIRHPGGFSVSGAPVGTLLRSALLVSGKRALGDRYKGSPFYESVEKDLAFAIMRSHFHHEYPKGAHCCVQCTLAVYPALVGGTMRYFDCAGLARQVKSLVRDGKWRFAKPPNAAMVRWSLGD
jgi:hypothetical protein